MNETWCYAVDNANGIVTIQNGVPTGVQSASAIDPAASPPSLSAIACADPRSGECLAVGAQLIGAGFNAYQYGVVVPVEGGSPGTPYVVTKGGLLGVTCPPQWSYATGAAQSCEAVGWYTPDGVDPEGVVTPVGSDPSAGTPLTALPSMRQANAIACVNNDMANCYVVGAQQLGPQEGHGGGVVVHLTKGVPDHSLSLPNTDTLTSVACDPSGACYAVGTGAGGGIVYDIAGGGGSAEPVVGTTRLEGIACPATNECFATGTSANPVNEDVGVVVPLYEGAPQDVTPAAGNGKLRGVACPVPDQCQTVGFGTSGAGGAVTQFGTLDLSGIPAAGTTR